MIPVLPILWFVASRGKNDDDYDFSADYYSTEGKNLARLKSDVQDFVKDIIKEGFGFIAVQAFFFGVGIARYLDSKELWSGDIVMSCLWMGGGLIFTVWQICRTSEYISDIRLAKAAIKVQKTLPQEPTVKIRPYRYYDVPELWKEIRESALWIIVIAALFIAIELFLHWRLSDLRSDMDGSAFMRVIYSVWIAMITGVAICAIRFEVYFIARLVGYAKEIHWRNYWCKVYLSTPL